MVYVSCPTPEQAELVIDAVLGFVESLDGVALAPSPRPEPKSIYDEPTERPERQDAQPAQAVEQQEPTQAAGDSQAIRQEYVDEDLQEP